MSPPLSPQQAHDIALARWARPHPAFASGHDPRSSDNAVLVLFYGSLAKAARYDWLNAGRTLVDKTYLRILWTVRALPPNGLSFDELASRLDSFVRTELKPRWTELEGLQDGVRQSIAPALVEQARLQLFGPDGSTDAASEILFYLCPQLPVMPCRKLEAGGYTDLVTEIHERLAGEAKDRLSLPQAVYGQDQERQLVDSLLARSDWWQRRVLAEQLYPNITERVT